MTKPMYCPMSFNNPVKRGAWHECTPDCAWAVKVNGNYACAIAANAYKDEYINIRPLKDDAE